MLNKNGDMNPEEFRSYGHKVVDWISDYLKNTEKYPVMAQVKPGEIKDRIPVTPPEKPEKMDDILKDFQDIILPGITHWNHPAFFAYFSITGSAPGILGEMLCSALNVNGMLWKSSPSATELETAVLDWLRQMIGLPPEFQGIIYDTASVSSMHAIAAARESLGLNVREEGLCGRPDMPKLRAYISEQTHSSVEKGAITLGIGRKNVRKIPVDEKFRIRPDKLQEAIEEDLKEGYRPFFVTATIGTTSTTSIDPVPAIADIAKKYNLWLHVDGAYGGSAAVVPEMKWIMEGCDRADSMVVNPHKWLFTPCDISVFYCKRFDTLKQAFSLVAEYLKTSEDSDVRNYMDYGVQLGRRFRSLKLWMVIRTFGHEGLADRLRFHMELAKKFASWIEGYENFELMAPVPFSTVCFRGKPKNMTEDELNLLNEKLMENVNRTGKVFFSHTKLNGKFTIRMAIGNLKTTEEHVKMAWNLVKKELKKLI
ncbi:MAG: aminotransferase class V-fold PLP-dependent enzyme [Candidatus Eremiobacterota bacterium]